MVFLRKKDFLKFMLGVLLALVFTFRDQIFFSLVSIASDLYTITFTPSEGLITTSSIDDGVVDLKKINQMSAIDGEILKWDVSSSLYAPAFEIGSAPTGGTVKSITPGTGFTSSTPITVSGTLNLDVGTAAGKIVQLDSSGNLPQVSGVNLSAIPATATFDNLSINGSLLGAVIEPYGVAAGETGELRLYELESNGTHYYAIKGPDSLTSDQTMKFKLDSNSNLTMNSSNPNERKIIMIDGSQDIILTTLPEYHNRLISNFDVSLYPTEVPLYLADNNMICIETNVAADFPKVIEAIVNSSSDIYHQIFYDAGGGATEPLDFFGPILIPGKTVHTYSRITTASSSRAIGLTTYYDQWDGSHNFTAVGNVQCYGVITAPFWPVLESVPNETLLTIDPSFKMRGWK